MRLKHVFIGEYKNLKNFAVDFTGENFMDVFVGKNGSGKSNFFEALILIFRHLYEFNDADATIYEFDYKLTYEIGGEDVAFEWKADNNTLKINGRTRKTLSNIPLPDNILVYYSGQNDTISELLGLYQSLFSKKIKGAEASDIRKFIGIGGPYKELLLSLILAQPEGSKAKEFLEEKLKIKRVSSELKVTLKRPEYALGNDEYDITDNDDAAIRYWGAKGISKVFLESIRDCISLDSTTRERAEGYQGGDDRYIHYYDIAKLQAVVEGKETLYLFRMLDNLKLIGMLEQVTIDIELEDGYDASISDFSDGQFQSVYIYAVTELFKESNCITLLDEPDAFLHPEWQFDFLKQVDEISEGAAQTNHVLMSSHSAITLIPHKNSTVKFFDLKASVSNCYELPKRVAINKLSSNIIKYSEQEQMLSILHRIKIENKPILFTEGHTDAKIITEAWRKLYDVEMPFEPFYAFSCTFINNLIRDERVHSEMDGKPLFALFDFDFAYSQWDGLKGEIVSNVLSEGLVKKWESGNSYAIMLPVPNNPDIQNQVIKDIPKQETFGDKSCCEIEHLFYGLTETERYFTKQVSPGGELIKFSSDGAKVAFSENIVPTLDAEHFEIFRPIFEFIKQQVTVVGDVTT
jgi:predicted ATPase